jgi:general secretion pathway protein I
MSRHYGNTFFTCRAKKTNGQETKTRGWRIETANRQPVTINQMLVTRGQQPVSRYKITATSSRQPAAGFTLLEVMVAMAIMAIVLVSVYRMHSQTLAMNTATRFYTQAPLLARSKLAQLESAASELIAGDAGDFGEEFPGYSWSVSTEQVSSEALGEVGDDLKRIDVTVSLNNDEFTYMVRTYLFMRE